MGLKTKIKLGAITFCIVIIIAVVFAIYLAMPDTVAVIDNSVKTNNYSREDFYTKYLDLKLEQEEAEKDENAERLSQSVLNYGQSNNSTIDAKDLSGKLINTSKLLCSAMNGKYSNDPGTWINDVTYSGRTITIAEGRADCSGLVSAILYLVGYDSKYTPRISDSFKNLLSIATEVNAKSCGELQVGDILVWRAANKGHVEIVVNKDANKIYVAGAGSDDAIKKTAQNGYKADIDLAKQIDIAFSWAISKYGVKTRVLRLNI